MSDTLAGPSGMPRGVRGVAPPGGMEHSAPISVRICHLYPRLLSVAGDRGNLFAITRRCAWRGIAATVVEAEVGEVPDFAGFDLVLLHGGQDCEMRVAADDLAMKAGSLRAAIEADVVVLAVCAGYQLLGKYYAPEAGAPIAGIGVLDAVTEGGATRFMGHIAVSCDFGRGGPQRLVGYENHSGRTYLGPGAGQLGRVIAGSGNNGGDGAEGARYREVYATYLHGPLLPKNPWLTDHLISRALRHHYPDEELLDRLAPLADEAETAAHAAALSHACRPAGRWRAALAARPRWRRAEPRGRQAIGSTYADGAAPPPEQASQAGQPVAGASQAAGGPRPAQAPSASKGIAWTSR
jgi:lipid II isoglutaminyl synthase (glutamine-hydrolysing)